MCKDAAAICCNQERGKVECQRGIDLIQSGEDCPNDVITDNIQRGARGRLWCTNNNISFSFNSSLLLSEGWIQRYLIIFALSQTVELHRRLTLKIWKCYKVAVSQSELSLFAR